jgi:hypothetical protein
LPKRLTTEEFIEKAIIRHGDRFDYSLVEYKHSEIEVTVICCASGHGAFSVTPHYHLRKRRNGGCPDCNTTKPFTKEEFIEKAIAKHGNRYDYSLVQYVNSQTKVKIICPDHGVIEPIPNDHLCGKGCQECGYVAMKEKQRKTQEQFIAQAKAKHSDRYDYSLVKYVNGRTDVAIICPDHDVFYQWPEKHLVGQGCDTCGNIQAGLKRKSNTEEFIRKAKKIHGERYDYSLVDYVDSMTEVEIICPVHNIVRQTPSGHLTSITGCGDCAPNKKLSAEIFIQRANVIHDYRYDYSLVEYVNANTIVLVKCPDHNTFPITPGNHLYGEKGCPDCTDWGFNPSDPAMLYYIAVTTDDGDTRYKIGITNNFDKRYYGPDLGRIRIVKTWQYAIGRAAREREQEIKDQFAGDRYYGPNILVRGNTELFTHDVLGLDKD